MSEWQPIETAPKDGTRILIYGPFGLQRGGGLHWSSAMITSRYIPSTGKGGEYGPFVWTDGEEVSATWAEKLPTHWQPLPAPPEVKP